MIERATQATRQLAVFTPLGTDHLLLHKFHGREGLSSLFEYELEMLSADSAIDPARIVGQNVTFLLNQSGADLRYFNGYVSRFRYTGQTDQAATYQATVVPWLWFLTNTIDCRIFQNKSTPEILRQIFTELGFSDFDDTQLSADYAPREYCVQYRESDFDFVSRLMEEEGLFYYFRHENGKHTLVLADHEISYFWLPQREVELGDPGRTGDLTDQITHWEHRYAYRPGSFAQTDYNFKTPTNNLMSTEATVVGSGDNRKYEIYEYPGRYDDRQRGAAWAKIRMEENETGYNTVTGVGTYRCFAPAGKFKVKNHLSVAEIGRYYTLVAVEQTASVDGAYITGTPAGEVRYENRFTCVPGDVVFRPRRTTRQPVVDGPQTAFVVGPPGEEIFPDEFGRVKVQFHWDREGRRNETSSCWLRVSQVHAGAGWGAIDLPRIGEEVIVDFLDGNPDRPIITGRVYNGKNMPPFALPGGMTRSGIKSQTHKGAGSNEISLDDTAGQEQIRMNAQYNMDTAVGNNQTLKVGVDRTTDVGNNDGLTVGNDVSESVGNNKTVVVGNDMNVNVGNKLVFNAGSSITLKCGASKLHMTSGGMITLTGTIITTAASANASVMAPMTQVVGGVMLTTLGGINVMQGGVAHVGGLGLCSVSGAKVDVAGGTTSIKGSPIKLN